MKLPNDLCDRWFLNFYELSQQLVMTADIYLQSCTIHKLLTLPVNLLSQILSDKIKDCGKISGPCLHPYTSGTTLMVTKRLQTPKSHQKRASARNPETLIFIGARDENRTRTGTSPEGF